MFDKIIILQHKNSTSKSFNAIENGRECYMRILYYTWYENSKKDMVDTFETLGHKVIECNISFQSYERDEIFEKQLKRMVLEMQCDLIFSFDFFPLIARVAEMLHKKYLSWIYDSPNYTLFSKTVRCDQNYIFIFDQAQCEVVRKLGAKKVHHLPLAVNAKRLNKQLGNLEQEVKYCCDVSFVGSLYDQNLYDQICYLPEYLRGYLEAIMAVQQKIYGYNLIPELLSDHIVKELNKYVNFGMSKDYMISDERMYSDALNAKITSNTRIHLLNEIAGKFNLNVYTASNKKLISNATIKEPIDYYQKMPEVFRSSKINLNMTLRSIETGIPLRALDIMGAGGFLMSNYQEELGKNFCDGKELVFFESETDLLDKISYFLFHNEERKEIAYHGWEKVQLKFSYLKQVRKMLNLAGVEEKDGQE